MSRIIVITGTDTGVGKTVFTAMLARRLTGRGASVAALKPICSGGRADAHALRQATNQVLSLDEINPWHFRAPLAPLLAARRERRQLSLREVVSHVHKIAMCFPLLLVEGAGGLLSPLGEGFSTRELIAGLGAEVIVVARSQLGVVNHVRLTLEALPPIVAARAHVLLMSPPRTELAHRTNPSLLGEFISPPRVHVLPCFREAQIERAHRRANVAAALDRVLH